MSHTLRAFALCGAVLLTAAGCEKKAVVAPQRLVLGAFAAETSTQRFIAEHHKLEILTPESNLQDSWNAMIAFCGTIRCEVLTSTITAKTGTTDPSGSMTLRVAPDDLQKLLARAEGLGQVATHTTEREDKTTAVIDTEAKLKNLTSFRDSLRQMLTKPSATVKDLVEIQQRLTQTQADLDSETAQRKILANETEKIAVEISLRVARVNEGGGTFSEIRDALGDSGSVLADSVASLITVVVAVIPWLVLIVPAVWLLGKLWRKLRRNRKGVQATAASESASNASKL